MDWENEYFHGLNLAVMSILPFNAHFISIFTHITKLMQHFLFFYLILVFACAFKFTSAQEIEWQNTIGGSGQELLHSVCATSDGGFFIGGSSNSDISGDKTENSKGGEDFWVLKLSAVGSIQWQRTIGGDDFDGVSCVVQTMDDGFLLTGGSDSDISGDKTEDSQGASDIWLVKLDASGNIEWQNTIGGSLGDNAHIADQTSDGGYIIGGHSFSSVSGDKTENSRGGLDYWILKLDSSGNIQWQKTIGGIGGDLLTGLKVTFDGGYIVSGTSDSDISGEKTENSIGYNDYWIVKLDSLGNIQWQNTIGGTGGDENPTIHILNSGNYVLSGYSGSGISGDKTENSKGVRDYWIVMLDSIGNIVTQKTIGGMVRDDVRSATSTFNGGSIHLGYSDSDISGDKTMNSKGGFWGDYWLVSIDSSGTILWQNSIGGSGDEIPDAIIETSDFGYIVAGSSDSNISGDKTENSNGNFDYWVVKVSSRRNLIIGDLYADMNQNNLNDTGDIAIIGEKVWETNTGRFSFSQTNGFYSLNVIDTGSFQVFPEVFSAYYSQSPLMHNAYFSSFNAVDLQNNFAFQPTGAFNDLCVSITPIGNFRSGFTASYMLNYSNIGTTPMNPTIKFYPDSHLTFLSSSQMPILTTQDSVIWNAGLLNPWQTGQILVTVSINSGLPIGTLINSGVVVEPIIGDANPTCNQSFWEVFTTGSFDPNDIFVNYDTLTTFAITNGQFLDYVIRFQNTGNDTAFTVKILNPIDTSRLSLSTFEFLNSSHPVNITWIPWEQNMKFKFDNILLPDSNINEPMSHGFVRYRIQPKYSLVAGDSITNFAAIYFDFNDPAITSTAKTYIVLPTSINEYLENNVSIYPNPFQNVISVELKTNLHQIINIELFNVYGQKLECLFSGMINSEDWISQYNLSGLSKGVYILTIKGHDSITQKIIKY